MPKAPDVAGAGSWGGGRWASVSKAMSKGSESSSLLFPTHNHPELPWRGPNPNLSEQSFALFLGRIRDLSGLLRTMHYCSHKLLQIASSKGMAGEPILPGRYPAIKREPSCSSDAVGKGLLFMTLE